MKIEITRLTSWNDVLNSARFTQRKPLLDKEPSDNFKKKMIRAEHSPLRCLMFFIDMYDIPYYVAMHFRTHKLVHAPFVSTSRPDVDGNQKPREEQKKTDLVNMRLMLDAQEIIAISKVRRCFKAEKETRLIWNQVIIELSKQESLLASACVSNCVYRGFCPEIETCFYGKHQESVFKVTREKYINKFKINEKD